VSKRVERQLWLAISIFSCANAARRQTPDAFRKMLGPGGILIDVASGSVVDEDTLIDALQVRGWG
jgi:hypothetical protein